MLLSSTQMILATVGASAAALPSTSSAAASAPTGSALPAGFDITAYWGNLSPYKDGPGFNVSTGVPLGCELSQVHVLHRHAQRYPTPYALDGLSMEAFAQKLQNYSLQHPNETLGTGPLAFLNDWKYLMGEDLLLPSGAATEATSGANFWNKYGRPLFRAPAGLADWDPSLNVYPNGTQRPKPIFRTTGQARILESARWWLSGFFSSTNANNSASQYDLVIIPETSGYNNTLAATCPEAQYEGDTSAETFLTKTTPAILNRLTPYLPRHLASTLTPLDILSMLNLCPYETAVLGSSAWCPLFTASDWETFAYALDLQFYGDYGFGAASGRAQGLGWVLELAARLNNTLITTPAANINLTYDSSPETFPLHQKLYMDMSHDDVIVSVLAALGVEYFNFGAAGLPGNVSVPPPRNFRLNEVAPFGAHLVAEVWSCPAGRERVLGGETLYVNPTVKGVVEAEDWIRFVLNGRAVPLGGVSGCEGDDSQDGFCLVEGLVGGVAEMVRLAEYDRACLGNGTAGKGGQVGDGRPE
ncbi:histidine phosphatase family protein [Aspergillus brunneoviolaceus CBS 621.78]|uniref:Phytase n=1 Tax=Aspergillus brunneoviolaceus CBS 621.78 TaxID=1450534 RepID=A0ACD1GI78_9EURO|nr:putative phytase [Aspergillus brunneoviolaceus CBS 621.78]RAH48865.1 putative phytase [Aspergillus brunneoviolaceus CBS 621.78]